ncbi:MAG: hypothetical protein P4M15_10720 [Alphaproteobacteria bacterium]|nr:hypothetical protein [Alphaproteobacteria bacterium]
MTHPQDGIGDFGNDGPAAEARMDFSLYPSLATMHLWTTTEIARRPSRQAQAARKPNSV